MFIASLYTYNSNCILPLPPSPPQLAVVSMDGDHATFYQSVSLPPRPEILTLRFMVIFLESQRSHSLQYHHRVGSFGQVMAMKSSRYAVFLAVLSFVAVCQKCFK
jgi:hypothetical protein